MSFENYFNEPQKYAYDNVYDENEDNENYEDNEDNENYEDYKNQIKLIESQQQDILGKIPSYIDTKTHGEVVDGYNNYNSSSNNNNNNKKTKNKYNQYYEHLRKKGAFVDNYKTRINRKTYSIDSSTRIMVPQIITKNSIFLSNNPLSFNTVNESIGVNTTTLDVLTIYYPNHDIKKGDQITLSGVEGLNVSISTIYNDINGDKKNAVIFTNYSTSVIFKCNFDTFIRDITSGELTGDIDTSMSFNPNFNIDDNMDLQNYDTENMTVTLSGFDISSIGLPFIGNIPTNFLNGTHKIYFTNPDYQIINGIKVYSSNNIINIPNEYGYIDNITGFYIKLDVPYNINNNLNNTQMIINMTFNYIGGIPLNMINAFYPVDIDNIKGSHEVYSISQNTINIAMSKKTYYKESFGGESIEISTLTNVSKGNSNPNNYSVELPTLINNITMVKLTSMTIPNTAKVFSNIIGNQNNKIYWKNQDDGDFIYSAEIPAGNYDPKTLQIVIQNQIYSVPKKYSNNTNQTTSYTNRTVVGVVINVPSNIVSFSCFKEATLKKPIQDILPHIPTVGDGTPPYTLTITQYNHGLLVGNTVTFTGFIATNGIPSDVLNQIHTILTVPNANTYTIKIDNFNLLTGSRSDTGGGFSCRVLVPSAFKLFFNYPDTFGKELGFRLVGQDISITPYNTVISNTDAYENEVITQDTDGTYYVSDKNGNRNFLSSNSLKLDGINYLMMTVRGLNNIINISSAKNISSYFAKINLRGLPGTMIYDDYLCPNMVFYEPIQLSKLDIAFYTPSGELYDFYGIDHNFTIEISNIEYIPIDTNIVSNYSMF
jgi:hypothetical protein